MAWGMGSVVTKRLRDGVSGVIKGLVEWARIRLRDLGTERLRDLGTKRLRDEGNGEENF